MYRMMILALWTGSAVNAQVCGSCIGGLIVSDLGISIEKGGLLVNDGATFNDRLTAHNGIEISDLGLVVTRGGLVVTSGAQH